MDRCRDDPPWKQRYEPYHYPRCGKPQPQLPQLQLPQPQSLTTNQSALQFPSPLHNAGMLEAVVATGGVTTGGFKTTIPLTEHKTPTKGKKKKNAVSKEERLRTPDKKFGGLTEEDVKKLLLPDHLAPNLDIIFVGINPGLVSAYKGHHYCNPTNHFWPLLYESGLISERLTFESDYRCLEFGIGMTNIVARTTRSAAELSKKEIADGKDAMVEMIARLKPLVVCFNGKGIYEVFSGIKKCAIGQQTNIGNTVVYVMPSTSGLVAQYPSRKDKLIFFNELKKLRDALKQQNAL